jgi:hypothetical protein
MGSGYAKEQYRGRFGQGDPAWSGEKGGECSIYEGRTKRLGEYEVSRAIDGDYELRKGGLVVGSFKGATIEKDRVMFQLSRGTNLEISEKGKREVLASEKAMLGGLIASDGGNHLYQRYDHRGRLRTQFKTGFDSKDFELIDLFDNLFESVYNERPHHYRGTNTITTKISHKGVFFDLNDLGVKTGPFRFHVPREHLDNEGKRAYLTGFFSGDGTVSRCRTLGGTKYEVRLYSIDRGGLAEIRQTFEDLGFHPHEIHKDNKEGEYYCFSIPSREHEEFIEEIGSFKPGHRPVFDEILEYRRRLRERRSR